MSLYAVAHAFGQFDETPISHEGEARLLKGAKPVASRNAKSVEEWCAEVPEPYQDVVRRAWADGYGRGGVHAIAEAFETAASRSARKELPPWKRAIVLFLVRMKIRLEGK